MLLIFCPTKNEERPILSSNKYIKLDESTVIFALKMILKGMSIQSIADVLEVQPATVSRWLLRAAKQCEKVNEDLMKDLNISKVEMDELWVIVKKSCTKNRN